MLIDDHQIILDGLNTLLPIVLEDCEIVAKSQSAEEAIPLLNHTPCDLIFMDIGLGQNMNGISATKKIKEHYPQLKIIALTMFEEKKIIGKMMRAGADGYLIKNADSEEIKKAVFNVMSGKKYLHESINQGLENYLQVQTIIEDTRISNAEKEVLILLCEGHTSKEIGQVLFRSEETIKSHRKNLLSKFQCKNVAALVNYAHEKLLLH